MSNDNYDIFVKNSIFPDTQEIFSFSLKSVQEIKDDCLIVLDTNALLVPYNTGKKSLTQIKTTYVKLIKGERLFIPGQVAREFATNRAEKLKEVFQKFNRKTGQLSKLQVGKYPLLESLEIYQKSIKLEKEIDDLIAKYREVLQNVLEQIRCWNWNDPVSLLYKDLFNNDTIVELDSPNENDLEQELRRRSIHSIPPGYKDANKDDSGVGDLIIWYTILELGKKYKKDIIFVSNEGRKGDWRYRSDNVTLYPRYELVDEFRRNSEGKSFQMLEFSGFLELYGADLSIVDEIKKEEDRTQVSVDTISFRPTWDDLENMLKSAGAQLIRYPNREVVVEKNGHTIKYQRPKRTQRPITENFVKELEQFLINAGRS